MLKQQLKIMRQMLQLFETVIDRPEKGYGACIVQKQPGKGRIETLTVPGISRQASCRRILAADHRRRQAEQVVQYALHVRAHQPRIGMRKLHHLLSAQSNDVLKAVRDRLFAILAEYRLLVQEKRAHHKTTLYRHHDRLKPDPEQVTAKHLDQVWVADITYPPARNEPL